MQPSMRVTVETHGGRWVENRPRSGRLKIDLAELWRFRELAWFLAQRDLKVRYKQAVFGAGWAVLQPLAGVVVFTIVFRRIARMPSEGVPYPLFSFASLAAWGILSNGVTKVTQSLVSNQALITKVYFPRLLMPLAALLPPLVDFGFALVILVGFMAFYGVVSGWPLLTLPLWIGALVAVALGVGLWLATLNVRYRDVNQAISVMVQLWLFVSPVAYPTSAVPATFRPLYSLNPMVGVLEGLRWATIGTPPPGPASVVSLLIGALVLAGGVRYLLAHERGFADVI